LTTIKATYKKVVHGYMSNKSAKAQTKRKLREQGKKQSKEF
jgi:hypothetical protein